MFLPPDTTTAEKKTNSGDQHATTVNKPQIKISLKIHKSSQPALPTLKHDFHIIFGHVLPHLASVVLTNYGRGARSHWTTTVQRTS